VGTSHGPDYHAYTILIVVRSKVGLAKAKHLSFTSTSRKSLVSHPVMTPLKAPATFGFNATFSCVFNIKKPTLVHAQVEETESRQPALPVQEAELPTNQPQPEKAKRKRKTKAEYAAMPPAVPKVKDKSKGGRPALLPEDKLICVSSMVPIKCHDRLKAASAKSGFTVSELIRWLIDGSGIRSTQQRMSQLAKGGLSEQERKQLRAVAGMAASFDQLAKLAQAAGYAAHATELLNSAAEIRKQVQAFIK
jgi:hypothetical protein